MPAKRRRSKPKKRQPLGYGTLRFFKRNARNFAVTGALIAVAALAWIIFDPYAAPTAVDADGTEVSLGPIDDNPDARPRAGSQAPNFLLADYDGNAVRLEDFRGKIVFLNFWATWCTACEAEMPDMNRLARLHPDDLVVVAVNRGESRGAAKKWSDARDLDNLVFLIDPRAFVGGFTLVFVALGASIGAVGYVVQDNMRIIERFAGVLLIVLGLNLMGVIKIPFLYRTYTVNFGEAS